MLEANGGAELDAAEAWRIWGERFYPVDPSHPAPGVVRGYVPLADLRAALEDRPKGALQCAISRSGEALLLSLGAEGATPRAGSRG